jgi:mono/diheme cytochrome c family protein
MNREQLIRYASAIALLSMCFAGAAQTQQSKPAQKDQQGVKPQSVSTHATKQKPSEGERIFTQNCARCHTPPDGFSPRISGTIVLHMRVRAALSAHDEQELLRYFNP